MVLGLVLYGCSAFFMLSLSYKVHYFALALQAISLSLVFVPCMLEIKESYGNSLLAAFVLEMGYSVNILVWGIIGTYMKHYSPLEQVAIKSTAAVGFALIYLVFGLQQEDTPNENKL